MEIKQEVYEKVCAIAQKEKRSVTKQIEQMLEEKVREYEKEQDKIISE